MTPEKLAGILSRMYHNARDGESTTMIRLFGIKYADKIEACDKSPEDIVRLSGIKKDSYGTEVRKGMKLAPHVIPPYLRNDD